MKKFYLILCILGIMLPYWQFLTWIAENAPAFDGLIREAFGSRISAFAWLDVIVSAVVLLGFILYEGRRLNIRRLWFPILGTCAVGVSFGLPLFLLMREVQLSKGP